MGWSRCCGASRSGWPVWNPRSRRGARHWKAVHLHKALEALPDDHTAADLHLDELDRAELAHEYPEMNADHVPTVEDIRSRFVMVAGGML
jgi:hypothetical protein